MLVALVYALGLWLFLALLGFYNSTRLKRLREKVRLIVTSNTGAIVIATGVLYLLRLQDFSRGVLGCFYVISTFALCLKYILMRRISNAMRAGGATSSTSSSSAAGISPGSMPTIYTPMRISATTSSVTPVSRGRGSTPRRCAPSTGWMNICTRALWTRRSSRWTRTRSHAYGA